MQMTREEAIRFLQDIKLSLDYLQQHYAQQKQEEQLLAKVYSEELSENITFKQCI